MFHAEARLAQAWCDTLTDLASVHADVAVALDQLQIAAKLAIADTLDEGARQVLQNIIVAAVDAESDRLALPDLSYAVERLRHHYSFPPPREIDDIRRHHHHLENMAAALRAEEQLRGSASRLVAIARNLGRDVDAVALEDTLRSDPLNVTAVRSAVAGALEATAAEEGRSRTRLRRLADQVTTVRDFSRVLVVEDLDYQRAQMRYAVELATTTTPPEQIAEATSVQDALRILERTPPGANLLLVTDLGLPDRPGEGASDLGGEDLVRQAWQLAAESWNLTVIMVTAQGRHYRRLARVLRPNRAPGAEPDPDAFLPKHERWPEELQAIVKRASQQPTIRDLDLEVLTFTGNTALLDGVPVEFTPMGFAWLDALADRRDFARAIERFAPSDARGHRPTPKTLSQLGLSVIMTASATLPNDTALFWDRVRKNGREDYLGTQINGRVRDRLRDLGIEWDGDLVESTRDDGRAARLKAGDGPQEDWDASTHALVVRSVRRWTSAEEYVRLSASSGSGTVLVIEPDPTYRRALRSSIEAITGSPVVVAQNADDAAANAIDRVAAIVLAIGDRRALRQREQLGARYGSIPVVALTNDDDPATQRALLGLIEDRGRGTPAQLSARLRSSLLGRIRDRVRKAGRPIEESEEVARILDQRLRAARRHRISLERPGQLHRITVPTDTDADRHVFTVDGLQCSLDPPVSRTGPEARTAHKLLLILAQLGNLRLDARVLLHRVLVADTELLASPRVDLRQRLTRGIASIRKAIRSAFAATGLAEADAEAFARDILRGDNPYELAGRVEVVGGSSSGVKIS